MVAPANDNFADATVVALTDGVYATTVDNTDATVETEPHPAGGGTSRTVWFTFTPPADTVVDLDTAGSEGLDGNAPDTTLAIYEFLPGAGGTTPDWLTEVASNTDDAVEGVVTSAIRGLALTGGTQYWVQIGARIFTDPVTEEMLSNRILYHFRFADVSGPAPLPVVGSDVSFGNYAIIISGETDVAWVAPAATPPLGAFPAALAPMRVHHNPGTPTLVQGRPVFPGFGTKTVGAWCDYLRVTVGGRDVTWFRGVQTIIRGWQQLDPYGDGPATLSFPGIWEFEKPGVGDLKWLHSSARVVINRMVGGVVVDAADPLYVGIVTRDTLESGPTQVDVEGDFMGRESRKLHQPYILHNPEHTLREHIDRIFRRVYRADFYLVGSVTGPQIRSRGDRSMTRLGVYDHWLGLSDQEDGTSYTLLPDRSAGRNTMRLQTRSMATVDATVWAGAHGVKVSLANDMQPNRVYGEGQSPNGSRWRNADYPNAGYDDDVVPYPIAGGAAFGIGTSDADTINSDGVTLLTRRLWSLGLLERDDAGTPDFDVEVEDAVNDFRRQLGLTRNGLVTEGLWGNLYHEGFNQQSLQGVHFEPLAAATETVQYLRAPGGREVGLNPDYDRKVMPFEEFVSFGENVTKREGKRNSRGRIKRAPERSGTITLTTDPGEMSRFALKGGMTLLVKNLAGTGVAGLKLYISSVEVDWPGQSVRLAVATTALHFGELATIRQRQMDARQNPSKRAQRMFRKSSGVSDRVIGWEAEGPSGVIARRHVTGGEWNEFQTVACEGGTLGDVRYVHDGKSAYWVVILGQKVNKAILTNRLGNPSTWRGLTPGRTVTGATESGASLIVCPGAGFDDGDLGRSVTGAGIPAGATISEVDNGSHAHVSPAATATAGGVTLTLGVGNEDNKQTTWEAHATWLRKHLAAQFYGTPDDPCGYWPRKRINDETGKPSNAPKTGLYTDDASQQFVTERCFLWVYVWPVESGTFHGSMKLVPGD